MRPNRFPALFSGVKAIRRRVINDKSHVIFAKFAERTRIVGKIIDILLVFPEAAVKHKLYAGFLKKLAKQAAAKIFPPAGRTAGKFGNRKLRRIGNLNRVVFYENRKVAFLLKRNDVVGIFFLSSAVIKDFNHSRLP